MTNKDTSKIQKIEADLAAARKACNDGHDTLTRPELAKLSENVKTLANALAGAITEGANPCPSCGAKPHGMRQNFTMGKHVRSGFEIGCTNCTDHKALGFSQSDAVEQWNGGPGSWLEPKDGRSREVTDDGEIVTVYPDGSRVNWSEKAKAKAEAEKAAAKKLADEAAVEAAKAKAAEEAAAAITTS